jgi:hypothetical protein
MKINRVAFWGFLLAGVLYIVAALRDIFAPGFFNMSPQIPTRTSIVVQFVLAGALLALAMFMKIKPKPTAVIEK